MSNESAGIGPEGYQLNARERDAIASFIDPGEKFAGRYVPQTLTRQGYSDVKLPVTLISDRRVLVLTPKGFMKNKWSVLNFPYSSLQPDVPTKTSELYGTTMYYAAAKTTSNDVYLFAFTDKQEWDNFSKTLEAMIMMSR